MGTLTGCIAKAGAALNSGDRAAILERSRALRASGVSTDLAAEQAVDEQIAAVKALLKEAMAKVGIGEVSEATHKDPGELAEAATPAVIAESLDKAAKREDRTPAQMRADLLAEPSQQPEPAEPEAAPQTTTENAEKPAPEKIEDFGEKIGGARKDTAESGATRTKKSAEDDRPAWARRFKIAQIVKAAGQIGSIKDEGRWIIRDSRSTDWTGQPRQVGRDTFATQEDAEAYVPIAAVSLKHKLGSTRDGKYEIWREVSDRKRVKVVDREFDTRDEAMEYMVKNAVAIIETNTTFGEADIPLPPDRTRTGPQRRTGDVKGEDFAKTFGFRGVEFGNWNNQVERQALMNDAFDGMMDLAEVLGVPPKALGLNGDLALAFGARGNGLNSARAHYELERAVINLTKERGAGSLAHEWFHALDHYFGRQDGKASAEWVVQKDGTRMLKVGEPEATMASGGMRGERSGVRPELRAAYEKLLQTMMKKAESYVEDTAKADKFTAATREELAQQIDALRKDLSEQKDPKYWKRNNKPASAELLAEFDTIAKAMVDGDTSAVATEWRTSPTSKAGIAARWTNDSLERLSAIYKEVRGRSGFDTTNQNGVMDRLRGYMNRYSQRLKMLADAQSGAEKTRMVPTEFAMNAKELDQGRGTDYWTTPHEMAARAFQGYVEDKVAERGGVSRFLNYGPENVGIPTPWGFKRPFPAGAERVAINKAFDAFVDEIQTRDTDTGTAMFSRSPGTKSNADNLQNLIDVVSAQWENAPPIVVVESLQDPKVPQEARDEDAKQRAGGAEGVPEGFYYKGKVYILADGISGARDALRVLFHETLGHHGLRNTFGRELSVILDRVALLNQGKVRAKAREYGLDYDKPSERRQAAEEVLAEMAQTNPELGWVQRAIAAIRSFLRRVVPGFAAMQFSDPEIIANFILPARAWVEGGSDALTMLRTAAPVFGRNDDTAFSRASEALDTLRSATTAKGLSTIAADLMQSDRSFNWWHRTIGTQYQKAKDNADFGRVYDAAQSYLHDTSAFANDAAALAPDVVPQLKGWRDAFKPLRLSDVDQNALASMVFKGTLDDKRVYTDAELRTEFKADDRQIKLYRQFRAAVDRSLDTLVATDVARYIGQDLPPTLKAMISNGDNGRFRGLVTAFAQQKKAEADAALAELKKANRKKLSGMWDDQKKRLAGTKPGSRLAIEQELEQSQAAIRAEVRTSEEIAQADVKRWTDFERVTREKYERIDQLKEEGYAPLMRFGQHTVYVTGPAGEQQFFGLYESQTDANRAAREFRESDAFKDSKVVTGMLSQEAYKQFSGMAPETLELFAEVSGVERTPLFEEYLRLTKSNRSALKRLISRKGIAGYSEDAQRVLASFLTSNARASSGNLHLGDMTRLVEEIPKEKGDVKDEAIKLQQYVQNPTEEAQRLRGLLFVQYLGGSVASALVNMTQPFMMTFPYLSQFGGAGKAAARLGAAMKAAMGKPTGELGRALAKAEKEGIVSPQELHQLQAESSRTMGNHPGVRRLLFAWGSAFSLAEQFNRRVSFIAAWNTAKEQQIANPFQFAADAVDQTQGVYNRGNRPNWARGPVGATLFTFKQYSISYLEFLKRLPPKQRAIALMVLMLAAGAQGLPFGDDLDDLIDTIGQGLGYDTNTKAWKAQVLTDAIGAEAADFALHGFSALPGFPLDVSGRLALSNLIPGTGMLLKHKTDKAGEVFDVLGPVGGVMRDALKGEFRPLAIRNLDKGLQMYQTGEYRDMRDRRVVDVDALDALVKGVGFQPAEVARESRKMQLSNQQVQLARNVEAEIATEWAQGIADREPEKIRKARERLAEWNRDNPRSRIAINSGQLQRRVRELRMTRQERFQKTVPREMRGSM